MESEIRTIKIFKEEKPVILSFNLTTQEVSFSSGSDESENIPFRHIELPEGEVKIFGTFDPEGITFIKQNPPTRVLNTSIQDNGLFGIRCWINPQTGEMNPPELPELLKLAKELGYEMNFGPIIASLLGMTNS